jgi:hypothetical protein
MRLTASLLKSLALSVALLALAAAPAAIAQKPVEKAYAPEDLTALTQPEQARVLEKQFAELSGGRPLPEDQLEFYLEQIPRGWTYAQITQDMNQSLRDRADGVRFGDSPPTLPPPAQWPTPGWTTPLPGRGQMIVCESKDGRYLECATGFRNSPVIDRQISSTRCVEGRNWGHRLGVIWVHGGCRARFRESAPVLGQLPETTCASAGGYRECNVAFRGPAELLRQVPRSSLCVEGRTWGQKPGLIWVDRGCGGIFAETYLPSGGFYDPNEYDEFTVDCASLGGTYAVCSWPARFGAPVLLAQYSRNACIQGVSWGYSPRRGLWVDRGCRARFGAPTAR